MDRPLIAPSEHLDQALATVQQAAFDFTTPDPEARARGEATFFALRQSDRALEYACYALQRSDEPLVLFQSLNTILFVLPSLPIQQPSPQIQTLAQLRDFVIHFSVSRGQHAAQSEIAAPLQPVASTRWPQYVRSRAYQTAIAIEKRVLGLELAQRASDNDINGAHSLVQEHIALLNSRLDQLSHLPAPWPADAVQSATVMATLVAGLGLTKAIVDEFVLSPASEAAPDAKERGKGKVVEPGTSIGLSVLEHRWCKAVIQNHVLPKLMSTNFQLLYAVVSAEADHQEDWRVSLFPQVVSTIEKLLSWTFILSDPFTSFGNINAQDDDSAFDDDDDGGAATNGSDPSSGRQYVRARRLPIQFVRVLLTPEVISLLATAYQFSLRANASIQDRDISLSVHRLRQCLLLAASFVPNKLDLSTDDQESLIRRTQHICATLQSLVQQECGSPTSALLSARGNAMLFLAQAFQIVLNANSVSLLAEALNTTDHDSSGFIAFLSSLSQLGKSIFGLAFHRPRDTDEEDDLAVLSEDTTEALLSCWQALLSALHREAELSGGKQPSPKLQILWQAVHGHVRDEVFNPYVTGRLQAAAIPSDDDVSEQDEATAKDRDSYSDQLITVAGLGRLSAPDNLRFLLTLAQPLCRALSATAQGKDVPDPQELEKVWEQTHWLLLIAGHLLADEAKGETPEVPSAIARSEEPEDPAVQLLAGLGLELLQALSSHGQRSAQATSPQVTETLLWFHGRWTATYLLIDDHSGFPTNAAIQRAFAGDAGRKVLAFLLERLRENLNLWMSDVDVLTQLAAVLSSFTRSSGIMLHLLQLSEMEGLVSAIVCGLDALPANTHGPLVSAVVSCIYSGASYVGQQTGRTAESYFSQITASIENRFGSLLQRGDFAAIAQRSDVISAVQTSLDMLDGLAASVQPNSADAVYAFLSKFFPALSQLCRVYEKRPEVALSIVKVLHTLAVALELDFGAEPYMVSGLNRVTREVMEALQGRTRHSLLVSDGGSPLEDEIPYEGLCLAIELLNELAGSAKAGNDESALAPSSDPSLSPNRTADVVLFGFESLAVLLDAEPLGLQRVRRGFAKLVSNILSLFSERLIGVALAASNDAGSGQQPRHPLLERTVTALSMVVMLDEVDCVASALEALTPFCRSVLKTLSRTQLASPDPLVALSGFLDHLVTTLLRLLFLDPLDSTLFEACLVAIRSLVMARLHSPNLPNAHETFAASLGAFVASVPLTSRSSTKGGTAAPAAAATPSLLSVDEPTRRQTFSEAVQRLVSDCIASLQPSLETSAVRPPWLVDVDLTVARSWNATERLQLTRFCAGWRPQVARVRARVRVR